MEQRDTKKEPAELAVDVLTIVAIVLMVVAVGCLIALMLPYPGAGQEKEKHPVAVIPGVLAPLTYYAPPVVLCPVQERPGGQAVITPDARPGRAPASQRYVRLTCLPVPPGSVEHGAYPQLGVLEDSDAVCFTFTPSDLRPESWHVGPLLDPVPLRLPGDPHAAKVRATNCLFVVACHHWGLARLLQAWPPPPFSLSPQQHADGSFVSAFLREVVRRSSLVPRSTGKLRTCMGWTFTSLDTVCALYFGVLQAPCFSWMWTPFYVRWGCYVVDLEPSANAPWTRAVVDVGQWESVLPGADPSRSAAYLLTPAGSSGFSLAVPPGSYSVTSYPAGGAVPPAPSPAGSSHFTGLPPGIPTGTETCLLGASCLANKAGMAVWFQPCDAWSTGMLGITTVQVGAITTDLVSFGP
jgi:hypothetical protein